MRRVMCKVGLAILVVAIGMGQALAQADAGPDINNDPIALGQPLSHWLNVVRDRRPEEIERAFDAIVELGPAASKAVPDLTRIVAEPFAPIRLGTDDRRDVLSKLLNIQMRAGAVDSLGAIGEGAASAADPVIRWALTLRVLSPSLRTSDDAFYIELVAMDVLERMRGAGATARFGVRAANAVQQLMESGDDEKIKFATAILSEGSLPIAANLMKSESCRDRILGLKILAGMWPVVPIDHLKDLKGILLCPPDRSEEGGIVGSDNVPPIKMRLPPR